MTEIRDQYIPLSFIKGLNMACTDGYAKFKKRVSERNRGLRVKRQLQPVNEVRILVK